MTKKPIATKQAVDALESAYRELAQAKVWRARAADTLDRSKADLEQASNKEYVCQSNVDTAREKLLECIESSLAEVTAP